MAKPTRESTKEYYERYHASPEAKKERAARNNARDRMEARGLVRKGDGKDVDHKKPLSRGGSNSDDNLRVQSRSANRGYKRDSKNRPI